MVNAVNTAMQTMDQNKLRTVVFEKTGIKIDTTDPVFALVALNDAVLAEYLEHHLSVMSQAADRVSQQTEQLVKANTTYKNLIQQIGDVAANANPDEVTAILKASNDDDISRTSRLFSQSNIKQWILFGGSIALLSSLLTIGGQWVIGQKDAAIPKIITQVVEAPLTAHQQKMIQSGEKLTKILPKLDTKTQARIQELMKQQ